MTSHTHVPDRVSALELFFDLVFVFTITEVAEVIVHHPDALGIGHAAIELSVLAWMFGGYAWLTNTAGAVTTSCRSVLLAGMAGFFVCALAVPHAFDEDGLVFGIGYFAVTVIHLSGLFLGTTPAASVRRLAAFNLTGAGLVVAAGFVTGPMDWALWGGAIVVQVATPFIARPAQGFVLNPTHFAERHGLIDQLTNWGLTTSLRQWLTWKAAGMDLSVAFNISALSLQHLDFPDLVERMCRALEVPTDRLVLELTEGATQPLVKLMDTLTRFRIKGIGLALDDFGVGYSTLMQLRQLPFTEIKIDRFFVKDLAESNDSRVIVASIVDLAHGLGLSVTAEGVETEEQLRYLAEVGCDVAQGYLVGTPLAPETVAPWCEEWAKRWEDYQMGQCRRTVPKARTSPQTARI